MITDKKEILAGNYMISQYLYGYPGVTDYYQIGYIGSNPLYRKIDDIEKENFHNCWKYIMDIIAKIAKDKIEDFSEEDKIIMELKNTMFEYAYEPLLTWECCLKYVKLKLTV